MDISAWLWALLASIISTMYFFIIKYYTIKHKTIYLIIVILLVLLLVYLYYKSLKLGFYY